MSPKSTILFGCGIFLLILGTAFSFVEHTPNSTVHSFAYGCTLKTLDFLERHHKSYWTAEWCSYNSALSVIVLCILGAGTLLTFGGLKNQTSDRRTTLRIVAIMAVFAGVILTMVFAVLVPIAECRSSGSQCMYGNEPEPARMPLDLLEGFFLMKHEKGEITVEDMIHLLEQEGYTIKEIEMFLAERMPFVDSPQFDFKNSSN